MPITNYPKLSGILPLEKIPDNLQNIEGVLLDIFDELYYDDLLLYVSAARDVGYYKLNLLINVRLALDIPGTGGVKLLLNPDFNNTTYSNIPISLSYNVPVLRYYKGIDISHPIFAQLKKNVLINGL